jgi:Rieske Fe-S protein
MSALHRRDFLRALATGIAAAATPGCSHRSLPAGIPPEAALGEVIDVSALRADGDTTLAARPGPDGAPILVARTGGELVALSLQCTHEGCPVRSTPVDGVLFCPCHGSRFDLRGNVLQGPADFALGRYETAYDAEKGRLTVLFGPSASWQQ